MIESVNQLTASAGSRISAYSPKNSDSKKSMNTLKQVPRRHLKETIEVRDPCEPVP